MQSNLIFFFVKKYVVKNKFKINKFLKICIKLMGLDMYITSIFDYAMSSLHI